MSNSVVELTNGGSTAVVYDSTGAYRQVGPDSVNVFEIAPGEFATISVPLPVAPGEHPDQTLPGEQPKPDQTLPPGEQPKPGQLPAEEIPKFAQKMLEFWKTFADGVKQMIKDRPQATPAGHAGPTPGPMSGPGAGPGHGPTIKK